MRIISGKLKGKKLLEFSHESTRPSLDNVKEAFFNIIFDKVKGDFLDLFAGTGGVGFEAYSRGANSVTLVENNQNAVKNILANIKNLNIGNGVTLLFSDYLKALKKLQKEGKTFDLIYIDPPYNSDFAEMSLKMIVELQLLNKNAIVVWEHDKTKLEKTNSFLLNTVETKKYGQCYLTIYSNE